MIKHGSIKWLSFAVTSLVLMFSACGGGGGGGGTSSSVSPTPPSSTVSSVSVTPSPAAATVGAQLQFTATATFSDGHQEDVTQTVTWSVGNSAVITISNSSGSKGLATGVAAGTSTVTAQFSSSISGTASVSVSSPPSTVSGPTSLSLYAAMSSSGLDKLYVFVDGAGSVNLHIPVVFDTGSAGLTLNALEVFPSSVVTSSGFNIPAGQSSITYNGITVTNQQGTREYGGANGKTENGNIGYAQVTFGDSGHELTTAQMPVFFYYSTTSTGGGAAISQDPIEGQFGVGPSAGVITVTGTANPSGGAPACTEQTDSNCRVVSVLKSINYGSGTNAGFELAPATLQSCDISTSGSCTAEPILTVGVTPALESGFTTSALVCPQSGYQGPATISGYAVCQPTISSTTFTVVGTDIGMLSTSVLFDTGNPNVKISVPSGTTFPSMVSSGNMVTVQTPSNFQYRYTAGAQGSPSYTVVTQNSTDYSSVGIGYFTTNSFFTDYASDTEGFK